MTEGPNIITIGIICAIETQKIKGTSLYPDDQKCIKPKIYLFCCVYLLLKK